MIQRIRSREEWGDKNVAQKGFTLVELIVVVTVLAILATVVVFSVGNVSSSSQTSACKTDASEIRTAIAAYQAKNGASTQPTMAQLVSDNELQAASTMYTIDWSSGLALVPTGQNSCSAG